MLRECGSKAWPALFAADNVTFGFAADELVNDCGKPFCVAVGVLNDKFGGKVVYFRNKEKAAREQLLTQVSLKYCNTTSDAKIQCDQTEKCKILKKLDQI